MRQEPWLESAINFPFWEKKKEEEKYLIPPSQLFVVIQNSNNTKFEAHPMDPGTKRLAALGEARNELGFEPPFSH